MKIKSFKKKVLSTLHVSVDVANANKNVKRSKRYPRKDPRGND